MLLSCVNILTRLNYFDLVKEFLWKVSRMQMQLGQTSERVHLHYFSLPFAPLPAAILIVEIKMFKLIFMELAIFHICCHFTSMVPYFFSS